MKNKYIRWDKETQEQFKVDYKNLTKKNLEEKYNLRFKTLALKAFYLKVKRDRVIANLTEQEILNLYNDGYSIPELSRFTTLSRHMIRSIVNSTFSKRQFRKYTFNENYFDKIDDQNKAYFLGFLYADGYNDEKHRRITIAIAEKDIEILEKFKILINYSGTIKKLTNIKTNLVNVNVQDQVKLELNSSHISKRLKELGCFRNKSLKLSFPNFITDELIPHFIRGYFDGDGCISFSENKPSFLILSNMEFLTDIQNNFIKNIGLGRTKIVKRGNVSTLRYSGRINCLKIRKYLYDNAETYLSRKYNRFHCFSDSETQVHRHKTLKESVDLNRIKY